MPTTQEGGTSLSRLVDCCQAASEGAVDKVLLRKRQDDNLISNGDKEHG